MRDFLEKMLRGGAEEIKVAEVAGSTQEVQGLTVSPWTPWVRAEHYMSSHTGRPGSSGPWFGLDNQEEPLLAKSLAPVKT